MMSTAQDINFSSLPKYAYYIPIIGKIQIIYDSAGPKQSYTYNQAQRKATKPSVVSVICFECTFACIN